MTRTITEKCLKLTMQNSRTFIKSFEKSAFCSSTYYPDIYQTFINLHILLEHENTKRLKSMKYHNIIYKLIGSTEKNECLKNQFGFQYSILVELQWTLTFQFVDFGWIQQMNLLLHNGAFLSTHWTIFFFFSVFFYPFMHTMRVFVELLIALCTT